MPDRSTTVAMGDLAAQTWSSQIGGFLLTTTSGYLRVWSPDLGRTTRELYLGGTLSGVSVIPGGGAMVGQKEATQTAGTADNWTSYRGKDTIYRIDLASFAYTPLTFEISGAERGVTDVASLANGKTLVTTEYSGSGWNPFRSFSTFSTTAQLATASVSGLSYGQITSPTWLIPSETGRYVLVLQGNISSAPIAVYDSVTDRISAQSSASAYNTPRADISEAAGLIVNTLYGYVYVYNMTLGMVKDLSSYQSAGRIAGAAFTQNGRQLAMWDSNAQSLVVLDTSTWAKVGSVPVQSTISSAGNTAPQGQMSLGDNGALMFMQTPNGFEIIDLSARMSLNVVGGFGNDTLYGSVGRDYLKGGGGADTLDGGAGVDRAVFSGASTDYTVTALGGGGWTVRDNRTAAGADGTDTLRNVELLMFSDKTVALDGSGVSEPLAAASAVTRFDPASPAAATVAADLSARMAAGASAEAAAQTLVTAAATTTSAATLAYQFFTGKTPSAAGMDYLVSPSGPNPNNLNSAYYQSFSLENRYINFAVNLGKIGEGKTAFQAAYGARSLADATKAAYTTIFGASPTDAKVADILNTSVTPSGVAMTRAQYFATYGGDGATGIGTKAAMVGWLLAEAEKADVGTYAKANDAFLLDVALRDAPFGVDLVGAYGRPEFAFAG